MMKMKKKYIAPQAEIVGGIYDTCILAGSKGEDSETGSTIGDKNNTESGEMGGNDGGNLDQGAKEHFNAWTAWDD